MILKLKAKIYQYTGVFLAYKEQDEYLDSSNCWGNILATYDDINNTLPLKTLYSLEKSSWQAENEFGRLYVGDFISEYNSWYKNVYIWCKTFVLTLKNDLTSLKNRGIIKK